MSSIAMKDQDLGQLNFYEKLSRRIGGLQCFPEVNFQLTLVGQFYFGGDKQLCCSLFT